MMDTSNPAFLTNVLYVLKVTLYSYLIGYTTTIKTKTDIRFNARQN